MVQPEVGIWSNRRKEEMVVRTEDRGKWNSVIVSQIKHGQFVKLDILLVSAQSSVRGVSPYIKGKFTGLATCRRGH
jgi:hypothetical protein